MKLNNYPDSTYVIWTWSRMIAKTLEIWRNDESEEK